MIKFSNIEMYVSIAIEHPRLTVSRSTVLRLSGRDFSSIIEAKSVKSYPIAHLSAMKLFDNCLTWLYIGVRPS